jgi:biotin carboxyl carrier protein
MSRSRGERLRVSVEGVDGATYELAPEAAGDAEGPQPAVRGRRASADDRAAGIQRYETTVDGWVLGVSVEDAARAALRERAGQGAGAGLRAGSDVVRAQIPGRVVRLWVAVGDTVEAGQRLLAIEAMKMENEVRAPHAGTIEEIHVEVDNSVELGNELVRLG